MCNRSCEMSNGTHSRPEGSRRLKCGGRVESGRGDTNFGTLGSGVSPEPLRSAMKWKRSVPARARAPKSAFG
jgi:hypothetical protein